MSNKETKSKGHADCALFSKGAMQTVLVWGQNRGVKSVVTFITCDMSVRNLRFYN